MVTRERYRRTLQTVVITNWVVSELFVFREEESGGKRERERERESG